MARFAQGQHKMGRQLWAIWAKGASYPKINNLNLSYVIIVTLQGRYICLEMI